MKNTKLSTVVMEMEGGEETFPIGRKKSEI
jgi:hypothetical protein